MGLKVGFVLDDTLDSTDGVQQYVLTLGQWLSAKGHTVHYLVGHTARRDIPRVHNLSRNVRVRFNGNRMSMPLPSSKKAIRALLEWEQFDVLHVQMPYSPFLAGRIIRAANKRTAVVGTFHVAPKSGLVHMANRLLRIMVRGSLPRFDAVMSVSEVARDFAAATFGIDSRVVPNLVDLKPFYRAKPFVRDENTLNIVFLGRLVARKGCQHLLHAIRRLHQAGVLVASSHKVIICGRGPLESSLRQYVAESGLSNLVTFTGYVSEEEKRQYLAAGDVVVFPSTGGESFGIVLVEAMAAARGAVLAGNNAGYAGVMGEHDEALFNPADEQQLADKIATLVADAAARGAARSWQQEYARQFDSEVIGRTVVDEYKAALHKRRN